MKRDKNGYVMLETAAEVRGFPFLGKIEGDMTVFCFLTDKARDEWSHNCVEEGYADDESWIRESAPADWNLTDDDDELPSGFVFVVRREFGQGGGMKR